MKRPRAGSTWTDHKAIQDNSRNGRGEEEDSELYQQRTLRRQQMAGVKGIISLGQIPRMVLLGQL